MWRGWSSLVPRPFSSLPPARPALPGNETQKGLGTKLGVELIDGGGGGGEEIPTEGDGQEEE